MNHARSVLVSLALVIGLAGCRAPETREAVPPPSRVILVVIDTLRADRLPFYGGPAHTAPWLAELADRSLVFERALSASSWTAPATASLFTGLYPNQHGVEYNVFSMRKRRRALGIDVDLRLPSNVETIPRLMRRLGYRTFGVSDNPNVDGYLGFDEGFDFFAGRSSIGKGGADAVARQVAAWRDAMLSSPRFFLYLHLQDPHTPYVRHLEWLVEDGGPPPAAHALDRAAYDSEIRFVDERLREMLLSIGLDERTLLIVTADHGQEFLDHGGQGHGFKLYGELTRVPLLIHREGDERLQGRVGEPVSHVDVLPTLRALLGDGDSAGELGVNLLALPREAAAERPLFAMRKGVLGRHEVELRSVVRGRYKLIVREPGAAVELYDWWADPGEQHDLSTLRPGIVSELRDLIAGQSGTRVVRSGAAESGGALDPALLEQLDELGYGTGGVNEGVPEAPSPPRPGGVEGPH